MNEYGSHSKLIDSRGAEIVYNISITIKFTFPAVLSSLITRRDQPSAW